MKLEFIFGSLRLIYILFWCQEYCLYWNGVWGYVLADSMDKKINSLTLSRMIKWWKQEKQGQKQREKKIKIYISFLMVCFLYKTLQWYQAK